MQAYAALSIAAGFDHVARQLQPLRRRMRAKAGGDGPHGVGGLLQRIKLHIAAQIGANAHNGFPLNHRPHIVENKLRTTTAGPD